MRVEGRSLREIAGKVAEAAARFKRVIVKCEEGWVAGLPESQRAVCTITPLGETGEEEEFWLRYEYEQAPLSHDVEFSMAVRVEDPKELEKLIEKLAEAPELGGAVSAFDAFIEYSVRTDPPFNTIAVDADIEDTGGKHPSGRVYVRYTPV